MKKQIIYTKSIPRLFAALLDMIAFSTICSVILTPLYHYFFSIYIPGDLNFNSFRISSFYDLPYYLWYAKNIPDHIIYSISAYYITITMLQILVAAAYFVGLWYKFQTTPGKLFLSMRIVNSKDFTTPSLGRLFIRFINLPFSILTFWIIIFDKKSLALHDRFAGTVVIKS
jgi:uncharacterized RDD family membrane protein YckC